MRSTSPPRTHTPMTPRARPRDTDGHDHGTPSALAWPRPWDPTEPIDVSGVEGVSVEQELRAVTLIEDTLRELPKFADPSAAIAAGYASIGDAGTGTEHYIKSDLIDDDVLLDPTAPSRSCTRWTATSGRSPARCTSPAPAPPTTRPSPSGRVR